jgi:hypothetical protein
MRNYRVIINAVSEGIWKTEVVDRVLCTVLSIVPIFRVAEKDKQDTSISWWETERKAQLHLRISEMSVAFRRTTRRYIISAFHANIQTCLFGTSL